MLKSIKEQLLDKYKYRIELHAHTSPVSPCGEASPEELVEIYAKKGFDAVTVTNHFFKDILGVMSKEDYLDIYLNAFEEAKTAAKKYGIKVYLGAELRFTENNNDYLVYGVDKEVLSICYDYFEKGISTFSNEISFDNSVIVQAHPFRNGCECVDSSLIDGYEIFNMHPNHNANIATAVRYAKDSNARVLTVGSDFHHKNRGHEGISAVRMSALPEDSFGLAQVLRSGDYVFEIGESAVVLP